MKSEKLLFGTFASLVLAGTSIPSDPEETTAIDCMPAPSTYPQLYTPFASVTDSSFEPKIEADGDYEPSLAGAYDWVDDSWISAWLLKLTLKCHDERLWKLYWGLLELPVDGEVQTAFADRSPKLTGWLNFTLRAKDGNNRCVAALWGNLSIDTQWKASKDPTRPVVKFEVIRSLLQSWKPSNMNAA